MHDEWKHVDVGMECSRRTDRYSTYLDSPPPSQYEPSLPIRSEAKYVWQELTHRKDSSIVASTLAAMCASAL